MCDRQIRTNTNELFANRGCSRTGRRRRGPHTHGLPALGHPLARYFTLLALLAVESGTPFFLPDSCTIIYLPWDRRGPVEPLGAHRASAARRWGEQLGLTKVNLQGTGNLGCRMKRQLLLRQSNELSTLFIGTDLPDLNSNDLQSAITSLQSHDLVLGPAEDGGYWLIGFSPKLLRRPHDWPLEGIPWGTSTVLEQTTAKATQNQLSTALIAQRNDLDHLSDLRPWQG